MYMLFSALQFICGIVSLICFIMVVIAMFKSGDTTLGIVCIVLFFCGIGSLIALVMGWVNAAKWNVQKIMPIWTGAILGAIVFAVLSVMTAPAGQGIQGIGG